MKQRKRMWHERVCSCLGDGTVIYLQTRLLRDIVNREVRAMMCTWDARRRYMKGLRAGLLCAETRHPIWAWRIWSRAQREVCNANWEWECVDLNPRYYSFDGVVAAEEARHLGVLIDRMVERLGLPDYAWHEERARADYRMLWLAKYGEPYWTQEWWSGDD